ncbi:hypothetical protein [Thermotoga sp. KOL6]|uniref:hypothetical protein n=1 Tax=Thermotoga sp. KOL6 TaxID=126741 RepID=UPI000C75D9CD|nr:hypothetical protein [Thermotoga sp. KOL6]PLV59277.1 hypothetical protein AS005_05925 [Thermotoga sp. KOL6]
MKYLLLFLATLLFDNSGTPLPILAASALIIAGKMDTFPAFLSIYLGLLGWDLLTFLLGKELKPILSKIKRKFIQRILKEFSGVYISSENILVLLCKFIPWIGKFTPFLAGYTGRGIETLLVIWAGDLLYESAFLFSSLTVGKVFLKYSKVLGVLLFVMTMILYILWRNRVKKIINKENG